MGQGMKIRLNKTALAFVLTAIALAVPSVAWYTSGVHEVETEAAQIE